MQCFQTKGRKVAQYFTDFLRLEHKFKLKILMGKIRKTTHPYPCAYILVHGIYSRMMMMTAAVMMTQKLHFFWFCWHAVHIFTIYLAHTRLNKSPDLNCCIRTVLWFGKILEIFLLVNAVIKNRDNDCIINFNFRTSAQRKKLLCSQFLETAVQPGSVQTYHFRSLTFTITTGLE